MRTLGSTAPEERIHPLQRLLENIPFLLLVGVLLPTLVYTVWSLAELRELPRFGGAPAAHGATTAAAPRATTAVPDGVTVAMRGMAFAPRTLHVAAGTTVTWVNEDPFDHAVASGTPDTPAGERLFEGSGDFPQGEHFSHTFQTPGTHDVYCSTTGHYAAGMTMTVIVREGDR